MLTHLVDKIEGEITLKFVLTNKEKMALCVKKKTASSEFLCNSPVHNF